MTEQPIGKPEDRHPVSPVRMTKSKPVGKIMQTSLREKLARVPKVTEPEFRLACNEIVEELAGNWTFKRDITVTMLVGFATLLGLFGLTLYEVQEREMSENRAAMQQEMDQNRTTIEKELSDAKIEVAKEIEAEFADSNIKKLVEQVAADQAATLIQKRVQPSIAEFDQHLAEQKTAVDKAVKPLSDELEKLKKRTEITDLADKAIEDCDLVSFHALRDMTQRDPIPEGAEANLLRVYAAYSIFAPVRWVGLKLIPQTIDPSKDKQEELSPEELLRVIGNDPNPMARGVAADLLANNAKPGSFATVKAIMTALQKEDNLEAIRREKRALSRAAPSFSDGGTVDAQDAFDWWKAHESEVAKADTDPKPPAPIAAPSATHASSAH